MSGVSFHFRGRGGQGPAAPGREVNIPGTQDKLVGRDGHLSAYSQKDLLRTVSHLMTMAGNGQVDIEGDNRQHRQGEAKQRQDALVAAFHDRSPASTQWAELGSSIGGAITQSADREGFMRRLLVRNELAMGNFPRIRVRKKNVTAMMMTSAAQVQPQFLKEFYLFPDEVTVSANIRVENREINQGSGDLLEEKFYEGQESIMVQEDRYWKQLADNTVGVDNNLQYLVGGLNPTSFTEMRTQLARWNITPMTALMSADYWNDITGSTQFSGWFDPVTKYEIITTGELGQMLGLTFITDGFRQEQLRVLNTGEIYIVGDPNMHGAYTDRGPVQSQEVNNYFEGVPARGWYMFEEMSFVIGNTRSVIKGLRA